LEGSRTQLLSRSTCRSNLLDRDTCSLETQATKYPGVIRVAICTHAGNCDPCHRGLSNKGRPVRHNKAPQGPRTLDHRDHRKLGRPDRYTLDHRDRRRPARLDHCRRGRPDLRNKARPDLRRLARLDHRMQLHQDLRNKGRRGRRIPNNCIRHSRWQDANERALQGKILRAAKVWLQHFAQPQYPI
jgi:hypothetical protein